MKSYPKITIGLPVFNGEEFLSERLKSILSQSFKDFELIISDNASTDSTSEICIRFSNIDKRIKYIKQDKNIGLIPNFNFILEISNSEYFVWASVDDIWDRQFLEKNLDILESKFNLVGSIGNVEFFGHKEQPKMNSRISSFKKIIRKQDSDPNFNHVMSATGDYEKKANKYLRFNQGSFIYGLFRTEKLKKRAVNGPIAAWDLIVILNILKEGDLYVIDEILMKKFVGGLSSKRWIDSFNRGDISVVDIILPLSSLTKWCIKNIGVKFFIKNIDWFIFLTIYGWFGLIQEFTINKK